MTIFTLAEQLKIFACAIAFFNTNMEIIYMQIEIEYYIINGIIYITQRTKRLVR